MELILVRKKTTSLCFDVLITPLNMPPIHAAIRHSMKYFRVPRQIPPEYYLRVKLHFLDCCSLSIFRYLSVIFVSVIPYGASFVHVNCEFSALF